MMKGTLNPKGIYTCCIHSIGDGMIKLCAKRCERHRVIVGVNVLLKVYSSVSPNDFVVGIDTGLSENDSNWFRGIVSNW